LCSFLIRRPPPERLPLVDEAQCSLEDYAMLLQLLQAAAVASVDFVRAVAEYWVNVASASQAAKYRTTIGDDLERIEVLKKRLVFQVKGADLFDILPTTDERMAVAALLDGVDDDCDESILIHVDQVIETKFGFTYIGWLVGTDPATQAALYLFALLEEGGAVFVGTRFPRADVAARWRRPNPDLGFAFSWCRPCTGFVVVGGGRKRVIRAPKS